MNDAMSDFPCPPDAIIFDMDGLLVDTERLWKIAETDFLARHGATYDEETHAPFIGMAMTEFMTNLKRVYRLEPDVPALVDELVKDVNKIIAMDVKTQPGALEIVRYVIDNDIPYAIASSSPMDVIHATIGSQPDWQGAFQVRCSADEVENGKPAPDVYLLAAERLGVDPTKCIALEDSPNGSRAAVTAGMTCFSVPDTSHSDPSRFVDITPHVYETLHDVLEVLKGCYDG